MNSSLKIGFIKANWHKEIVSQALIGFKEELEKSKIDFEIKTWSVPGAFEIPLLAQRLAQTNKFDFIVCAAFVVDGGIYRHDFIAQSVINGIMQVQLSSNIPIFSVSLTPHNFQPTKEFVKFYMTHFIEKGKEAAVAINQIRQIII